jgi:hypothetical protein
VQIVLWGLLLGAVLPALAFAGVTPTISLVNNGDGTYTYTFVITNTGPSLDAVFKWDTDTGTAPTEWQTVSFNVPDGWTGDHPDHHLDFMTGNGDGTTTRIFGPGACGSSTGTFSWTFTNNGGPTPTLASIGIQDIVFHLQPIDSNCHNYGTTYTVRNGGTPVEPASWGSIKSLYR